MTSQESRIKFLNLVQRMSESAQEKIDFLNELIDAGKNSTREGRAQLVVDLTAIRDLIKFQDESIKGLVEINMRHEEIQERHLKELREIADILDAR